MKQKKYKLIGTSPFCAPNLNGIADVVIKPGEIITLVSSGYFIDENKIPLSMLEIRNKFKDLAFTTYVDASKPIGDIQKQKEKNQDKNLKKISLTN